MRRTVLLLGCLLAAGCLGVDSGGFGGDNDDPIEPDGDADVDADVDADSDADIWSCPAYPQPEAGFGMGQGDVIGDISFAGNGPEEQTWSMGDFWCAAQREEAPATVLMLNVHSMTCSICLSQAAPELEVWWNEYGDRGLVPFGVSIKESLDSARGYWEDQLGHTHPWAADPAFSTAGFFEGPVIGTPGWVVVDLSTMQIVATQEGYSGAEENLFLPYLR